jgi:hypothetical protein
MRSHPREKTGRNDPCSCGSGKKYKHCCLSSGPVSISVPTFQDTPWGRQNQASEQLNKALQNEFLQEFDNDAVVDTWRDFNQTDDAPPMDSMREEMSIFIPYLLYQWDTEERARRNDGKPKGGAVVRSYMKKNAHRLSELELQVLEQAISRPVSFYEVVRSDPGRGVCLRDLLIGEETEVEEHSASQMMRPGDIAYGQIWMMPGVATLGRLAPRMIPPEQKIVILKLRAYLCQTISKEKRKLCAADLVRCAYEIRATYLAIRNSMLRPPTLQNTDGDPFVFHTLTFRIGSAQMAFDALASLAWNVAKEDLLDEAERDSGGILQSVEIPWSKKGNKLHKTWDNTILGHLKIDRHLLTVEVNSANRAKKIREEIEQRLWLHATPLSTTSHTMEESLKKSKQLTQPASREIEEADSALNPELMKEFAVQMQKEVEAWVHKKVPALGGKTPMQAVKTSEGREMVDGGFKLQVQQNPQ